MKPQNVARLPISYLIIDNVTLIHIGASLNCLGKRCFAFSTLDAAFIPDIMARVP